MAYTSVTYTFSNSTTADATQVNQNFTDLINGLSDGTKDLSVSALTAAGTSTLNGNVNLGNSSSDDLTITAALAGSISVKTTATYNVGSSTLGLLSIYLGAASSYTVRLTPSASQTATYTLTTPVTAGVKGQVLYNGGSATLEWQPAQAGVHSLSNADYTVLDNDGYGVINVTTGNTDRTITLPTATDNTGRKINIIKIDSGTGNVILDGESTETINGATTFTMVGQYATAEIVCNGTAWYLNSGILAKYKEYTAATTSPSATLNVDAVSQTTFYYHRFMNIVYWNAEFSLNCTSTGSTQFDFTLPVSGAQSTFAPIGSGMHGTAVGTTAPAIVLNVNSTSARVYLSALSTSALSIYLTGFYYVA